MPCIGPDMTSMRRFNWFYLSDFHLRALTRICFEVSKIIAVPGTDLIFMTKCETITSAVTPSGGAEP